VNADIYANANADAIAVKVQLKIGCRFEIISDSTTA
jgi:hypothetical protein